MSMESLTKGLNRLSGGVLGSIFAQKNDNNNNNNDVDIKAQNKTNNIEYVDELSSSLYPDLQEDISGARGNGKMQNNDKDGDGDDDFLILESTEVQAPSCPYFYLPFSQSVDMCNTLVKHWLERIWFLPADWKTELQILPGRPTLVPFYIFNAKTHSKIMAEILVDGESGGREWSQKSDRINNEYKEVIVCASCVVNQKLVDRLLHEEHGFSFHTNIALPSNLHAYPPPNDEAVTTVPSENILPIDISKDDAWQVGKYKVEEEEKKKAHEKISANHAAYDVHSVRNVTVDTEYFLNHFVVYLPIYFCSYEYSSQIYEVLVSGNKGVVVGNNIRERPIGTGAGGKFIMDKLKSLSNLVVDTVPM